MFLNPGVITQSFNPMAELAIPREIPTSETEAEIEIQPVIVETQVSFQRNLMKMALRHGCSFLNLLHIFRALFPKNTSE